MRHTSMVEFVRYIPIFFFVWVTGFLWHELLHIKNRYPFMQTGTIFVHRLGFTCIGDEITNISRWFFLAGGLLTGIVFLIVGILCLDTIWRNCLIWCGFLNLCYGVFEYKYLGTLNNHQYVVGRYTLYFVVLLLQVSVFIIKGWI